MIRLALIQETPIIKKMWEEALLGDQGYIDFYFKHVFRPQNCLVNEEDGQIVSSLQMNPHQLMIDSRIMSVVYIVGVCTTKAYRNQGYMQELLTAAIQYQHKKCQLILIQSSQPSLYYSYGFEQAYHKSHYLLTRLELLKIQSPLKVGLIEKKHVSSMMRCYADYTKRFDGVILRDEEDFERLLLQLEYEDAHILGCFKGADMLGYICYKQLQGQVIVPEVIYKDEQALLTMLRVMATKGHRVQMTTDTSIDLSKYIDVEKKAIKPTVLVRMMEPEVLSKWLQRPIHHVKDLFIGESYINEEF